MITPMPMIITSQQSSCDNLTCITINNTMNCLCNDVMSTGEKTFILIFIGICVILLLWLIWYMIWGE